MFSAALKSFSSNISSNYTIAPQPASYCGPWKIFDAKRKSTGKTASVFVFDKKSLEPQSTGLGGRSTGSSLKQAHQEVLDRLKREASSLARLRHPSILELVEPVEDTRNGGLMFATEPVTASLAAILAEQDERAGRRTRSSKVGSGQDDDSTAYELDELEMQKGLLQLGKGLEFLHDSAGLVHANLTPDAVIVNAKGDWKITGLAFTGPAADSSKPGSSSPIYLNEALNYDSRLPENVQLSLDYSSPDFVLDNNVTASADMFSLGLLIIALYNSPHASPVQCHGSTSAYKRTFASSSTVPSQHNNFLAKGKLPPNLASNLLPQLITRRPAQRLTAKTFQQASYFDNILVSTIRFLDSLPAKTVNEKTQFLRGLPRIMPQFPSSVLEKKVLPALLDETKDRELLASILQNVFAIIKAAPDGKRPFVDKVIPKLREIFVTGGASKPGAAAEKDPAKDAGIMIVLENMKTVADCTTGKDFHDDILPLIAVGLSSTTHAIVDASLATLPIVTPKLDYTTIKNELFPIIAAVFAHTSSLAIKIQGLEAFNILCGGTDENESMGDGLDGETVRNDSRATSSSVLDKFTIQEKIMPLLKGIRTKEPAVMMAALKVFRQMGKVADTDFVATEMLPVLWAFALGPLLDLTQFQAFMGLIKGLSARIEREHSKKLQQLSTGDPATGLRAKGKSGQGAGAASQVGGGEEVDFESLVTGRKTVSRASDIIDEWDDAARPSVPSGGSMMNGNLAPRNGSLGGRLHPGLTSTAASTRSVTPDQSLGGFAALTPASAFNQPLQPSRASSATTTTAQIPFRSAQPQAAAAAPPAAPPSSTIDWSAAASRSSAGAWATTSAPRTMSASSSSAFSIPPPPGVSRQGSQTGVLGASSRPQQQQQQQAAGGYAGGGLGGIMAPPLQPQQQLGGRHVSQPVVQTAAGGQGAKQGLDKYESLL